jgi:formylglycine-generating enzyme required for sulfatase activity
MGSVEDEPGRHRDESPQHQTTLSKPFFLGITPVTQEQFFRVMGQQPSHFREEGYRATFVRKLPTHSFPVENISWGDAERFCHELSNLPEEQEAGRVYRLPTEAEWEYAARAGTTTMFHFGDGLSSEQANINGGTPYNAPKGRFLERPCPVGLFPANAFGLHDMHGNVWEWCSDWFQTHVYTNSVRIDPRGPTRGDRRVLRGGSWFYGALISRSAYRYRFEPGERNDDFGMRVAMDIVR